MNSAHLISDWAVLRFLDALRDMLWVFYWLAAGELFDETLGKTRPS
jgi:hypothetical protein